MISYDFPPALQAVIDAYDASSGCYRREDGSLDTCPTELEVLEIWRSLIKCTKPRVVVETGVYQGLSTCFIASALLEAKVPDPAIYCVDPWQIPHLWENTPFADIIHYIPKGTQDAMVDLAGLEIDVLIIDSIHTYAQSSWELQALEPAVREGGLILLHDSLYFDGVGRTVEHLYSDPRFETFTFDTPRTQAAPDVRGGKASMGCTLVRKVKHGEPIVRDKGWLNAPERAPAGPEPHIRGVAASRAAMG